jgi:hypothetical protein
MKKPVVMNERKKKSPSQMVAVIDNTTPYDTITLEQWHDFREEEYRKFEEEKLLKK